jgi:hypothetical protein
MTAVDNIWESVVRIMDDIWTLITVLGPVYYRDFPEFRLRVNEDGSPYYPFHRS